jgi:hypothetical protein
MNKMLYTALAATALCALPSTANAALLASLGGGTGPFSTLSSAGLDGGATATLSGGKVYTSDQPFADIPKDGVPGGTFLAAGPTAGQPATLSFTQPLGYLSFLWGSPDTYNVLTLTTNVKSYTFDAVGLNFAVTNGNQSVSQYVQFAASAGESISSVSFNNSPARDAFEVANFSVAAVPEPATWAMMLVGFGMTGAAMRTRRRAVKVAYA